MIIMPRLNIQVINLIRYCLSGKAENYTGNEQRYWRLFLCAYTDNSKHRIYFLIQLFCSQNPSCSGLRHKANIVDKGLQKQKWKQPGSKQKNKVRKVCPYFALWSPYLPAHCGQQLHWSPPSLALQKQHHLSKMVTNTVGPLCCKLLTHLYTCCQLLNVRWQMIVLRQ